MQAKISNGQTAMLVVLAVTTYSIVDIPSRMASAAGRAAVIPLVCAGAVFAALAYLILRINILHNGVGVLEYSKTLFGTIGAKITAAILAIDFTVNCICLSGNVTNLISSNFLPKSPKIVLTAVMILVCAFVAGAGLNSLARMALITGVLVAVTSLSVCVTMLICGQKYNVLPLFNLGDITSVKGLFLSLIMPFSGIEILLVLKTGSNNIEKKTALVVFLIAIFYAVVVESTVSILGINNTIFLNDSFVEGIKATPAPGIERLDVMYLTFGLAGQFCGVSAMLYAAQKCFSKLIEINNKICILSVLLIILITLGVTEYDVRQINNKIMPVLMIISVVIIPSVMIIKTKISGVKNEKYS